MLRREDTCNTHVVDDFLFPSFVVKNAITCGAQFGSNMIYN